MRKQVTCAILAAALNGLFLNAFITADARSGDAAAQMPSTQIAPLETVVTTAARLTG